MDMYYENMAAIFEENDSQELKNTIHYHNITHDDMVNGPGLRVVLWVSGCIHKCKGCHNPITWDPNVGVPFTEWEEAEFWEWLAKPWTRGATFSGGDPLHPANRVKIGRMIKQIRERFPTKDIWVYTGYRLTDNFELADSEDNTFTLDYLPDIDVLVDGKFECETRRHDIELQKKVLWRGSSNQRVIDIKKTLEEKRIVERY